MRHGHDVRNDYRLLLAMTLPLAVACGGSSESAGTRESEDVAFDAGVSPVATTNPEPDDGSTGGQGGSNGDARGGGAGMGPVPGGSGGGAVRVPMAGDPLPRPLALDDEPQHHRYVRLTHDQWENSVRDNLRLTEPTGLVGTLFPDARFYDYSNNEALLEVGPTLYLDYEQAAETLGGALGSDPELLALVYSGDDALGFISEVGRRFYRRPLTSEEIASYEVIFETGAGLPSAVDAFSGGASLVVEVLLQAPSFLYRIESAAPGATLDAYELATKLAYFVTNSTPSDALLAQAEAGELDSAEGVRAAAEVLLASERATAQMRRFHGETFVFDAFRSIAKDPALGYETATNADLEEASYLFFDRIFESSLGLRDVLLSNEAFATDSMAALYGFAAPGTNELVAVALGSERRGFFTQLPFLILHSFGTTPDSIGRGLVINDDVLCVDLPSDPEGLNPTPLMPGNTNRETITGYTAAPECATCHHGYLNPLGFAFENYDGLGRERDQDNGVPVDTTGSYPFVEGQLDFDGAPELMELLAESQQSHTCYASHLAEFGLARSLGPEDRSLLDALSAASLVDNASLRALILELVASPTFRTRQATP